MVRFPISITESNEWLVQFSGKEIEFLPENGLKESLIQLKNLITSVDSIQFKEALQLPLIIQRINI